MQEKRKAHISRGCLITSILAIVIFIACACIVIFKPGVKDMVVLQPDSPDAAKWFKKSFGFRCPDSVSNHYYAYYWRTRDPWHINRFNCTDRNVIDKIIHDKNLRPSKSESGLYASAFPPWWPTNNELEKFEEVYKNVKNLKSFKYLWVDKQNGIIYFMSGVM